MFSIANHKREWFVNQLDKLKEKGLTNMDIAHGLGVSYQYVSDIRHDRKPVSDAMFDALVNNFGIEGFSPFNDIDKEIEEIQNRAGAPLVPDEYIPLALQGADIAEKLNLPLHKVPGMTAADFLMQANTDSMADQIQKTDIVGVKALSLPSFYQPDGIYVISTAQGVLIRNATGNKASNVVSLTATNPKYKAFDIDKKDILGMGIIVGFTRNLL